MWTLLEAQEYVTGRIDLHTAAEDMADDVLFECTPEERWEKEAVFAIHQGTAYKAKKLCSTREEADIWIASHGPKSNYSINLRPTEWKRCEQYCDASDFCSQFREFQDAPQTEADGSSW